LAPIEADTDGERGAEEIGDGGLKANGKEGEAEQAVGDEKDGGERPGPAAGAPEGGGEEGGVGDFEVGEGFAGEGAAGAGDDPGEGEGPGGGGEVLEREMVTAEVKGAGEGGTEKAAEGGRAEKWIVREEMRVLKEEKAVAAEEGTDEERSAETGGAAGVEGGLRGAPDEEEVSGEGGERKQEGVKGHIEGGRGGENITGDGNVFWISPWRDMRNLFFFMTMTMH
jgi:hypothetical protein